MSALLGVFGPACHRLGPAALQLMLEPMRGRGGGHTGVWRGSEATLVVLRHDWELTPGFANGEMVVEDGDLVLIADAAIYYRHDLIRRLGATRHFEGLSPGRLILAAFRAWGVSLIDRLEGDFAFLIYDRAKRRLVCGRDAAGSRALFHGFLDGSCVVASAASAIAAHPSWRGELNLAALAEVAAALIPANHETSYAGIERVPAGMILVSGPGSPTPLREAARAAAPLATMDDRRPMVDVEEELRHVLTGAVRERLSPDGDTALWLSGGYDSTSLYAVGMDLLRPTGDDRVMKPVSIRYPPNDPGHEDAYVQAVVDFWGGRVDWVDSESIAPFADLAHRATGWDDAGAHLFEAWNRATVLRSRALGCSVALTGMGGDALFAAFHGYLTDLVMRGRMRAVFHEWRARGRPRLLEFLRDAGRPAGLDSLVDTVRRGRKDIVRPAFMERRAPRWIRKDFASQVGLHERQRHTPPRGSSGFAGRQFTHYLTHPYCARNPELISSMATAHGVDVRNPLYDRRVIEFAGRRPLDDRRAGGESKRLLRAAMRDLLPAMLLASRPVRTGVTTGLLAREVRSRGRALFDTAFARPVLADLGMVDPESLRESWNEYASGRSLSGGAELVTTLNVELWLRGRGYGAESVDHMVMATG